MKRAPLVTLSTFAGVAGVLILNPSGAGSPIALAGSTANTTSGATNTANSSGTTAGSTAGATTSTSTAAATPAKATGTATGDAVDARYGLVQVKVTAKNGKITDVTAVQLPNGDGRSMMISQQVEPMLKQQALAAQSANIQGVSGASYTSYGYQQSLQSALTKLGM